MNLGNLISESNFELLPPGWLFGRVAHLKRFEHGFSLLGTKHPEIVSRYDEVPAFSEHKVSFSMNGQPSGLVYYFNFSWPIASPKLISYILQIPPEGSFWKGTMCNPSSNDDLELLKLDLSIGIASRMIREWNQGRKVQWTPDVFLGPEGVELRSAKTPGIIPFGEIDRCEMLDDKLSLRSSSASLSMLNIPFAALNFHPGLRVLNAILNSAA